MASILLTIHIIVAISLVISVLLQRGEGGLGGLGGGMSNIMSSQSSNNFITKLTPSSTVMLNLVIVLSVIGI